MRLDNKKEEERHKNGYTLQVCLVVCLISECVIRQNPKHEHGQMTLNPGYIFGPLYKFDSTSSASHFYLETCMHDKNITAFGTISQLSAAAASLPSIPVQAPSAPQSQLLYYSICHSHQRDEAPKSHD